jgi:hypothetical protein
MSVFHRFGMYALGVCLPMLLSAQGLAQEPQAAEPVQIDIPESALKSGLLTSHLEQVSRAVEYWLNRMRDAGDDQEILAARKGLIADYNRYYSIKYQYVFAEQVARGIPELLKLEDPRKQINAGLAVSQMRQVTVQPALEVMLTHPDPAVRLYAWQGYRRIRLLVLAQGKEFAETTYSSLAKAAAREDCPPVLQEAFGMFRVESDPPRTISPQDFEQARKRLFAIFQGIWPRLCERVAEGDLEMSICCRDGIAALRAVHGTLAGDGAISQTVIQMVYDMMWSAAKGLTASEADSPVSAALETMLGDCENALNYVTRLGKVLMTSALAAKDQTDRNLAVLSAVQGWREALIAAGYTLAKPGASQEPTSAPSAPPADR